VLVPAELEPEQVRQLYDDRWVLLSSLAEVGLEGPQGRGTSGAVSGGG
jgi:hypothetical protein